MSENNGVRYEFGRFCLEPGEQRLLRDDEPVPLPPKVLDTLTTLVQQSGHILTKDELLATVWSDTFVAESSLTRNISLLRKALGENEDEKYIETLPKRGYRFVAPVKIVRNETFAAEETTNGDAIQRFSFSSDNKSRNLRRNSFGKRSWVLAGLLLVVVSTMLAGYVWRSMRENAKRSTVASEPAVASLAVLPFKVIGDGGDANFIGLGMADAIIMRLSDGQDCRIRPTSAISRYAAREFDAFKVGRELGVDAVLDGTVQRFGDQVRVTAILWDLHDGHQIWSGKFDERERDIFALQDSISNQVAERLKVNVALTSRRTRFTQNVEAYRYYAMGYYFWSKLEKTNLGKAINYFNQAVREDPNYSLAYSALADSYLLDAYYGYQNVTLQEAYDRAKAAAAKAVELDENLPEANIANGMVKEFEGDLAGAEKFFQRAIELNPSSPIARLRYSHLLALTSRLDQAISELRIAEKIDPVSARLSLALGGYLFLAGRYDEAIKYNRLALELNPESYSARENLAWAYAAKAMYPEAQAEFGLLQQARESCRYSPAGMAYIAAKKGKLQEARELLAEAGKEIGNGNPPAGTSLQIAKVFSVLGEKEGALSWIRRAFDSGRLQPYELEYSSELSPLRSDARFARILEEVRTARPPVTRS